ncbi:hypothetical protein AAGO28_02920, partial [Klebsiella pneumoniae]
QTETEATGAPQKHHYTLNQQVGSITRWLHRLPAGQGSPLPEYCASSLFITLINIFYMNTCHCRQ